MCLDLIVNHESLVDHFPHYDAVICPHMVHGFLCKASIIALLIWGLLFYPYRCMNCMPRAYYTFASKQQIIGGYPFLGD